MLIAALVAAGGAPFYLRSIERDLERRVPDELASRGVAGVTAAFSGQQGTLHCEAPLTDPEAVLDVANAVDGVALIELDRSCRVSPAPVVDPTVADTDPPDTDPPETDPAETDPAEIPSDASVADADDADTFATVGELVRSSQRFSLLATLLREADAVDLYDDPGITIFAPTDDAFDELAADVLAELRTRPGLLVQFLRNHVVDEVVPLAELGRLADAAADGDAAAIETRHGSDLELGRTDTAITIAGASVLEGDLVSDDGVLHVVDRPLLPADLELRALDGPSEFVAVLRRGELELAGPVASADGRTRLIGAAATAVAASNVVHGVEVDPTAPLGGDDIDVLVELLEVVPAALTSGSVGIDGSEVFVRGTVVDDEARAALRSAAPDATLELDPRPPAITADVADVNDELASVLQSSPVTFAPGSAEFDATAAAVLDELAAVAKRFAGVTVVIEGHTDTAGDQQSNLELSELRAAVVRLELVARGVPGEQLDHVGRGGAEPVVVDGVEDRAASRRIELVATLDP
ncbi:MAG: fasciclin domain-containing protein [Ilumatobacteraceae bacterium]